MGFKGLDDLYEDTSSWTKGDCYLCYLNLAHMVDHALVDEDWAKDLAAVDFSACDNLVRALAAVAVGDHPRRRGALSAGQLAALDSARPIAGGLSIGDIGFVPNARAASLGVSM